MKKCLIFLFLIIFVLSLVACKREKKYIEAEFQYTIKGNEFTIVNFADTQMDDPNDLNDGEPVYEIIKHAIETEKPDIITFSGDNAWLERTLEVYQRLVQRMDEFEVPYFFTFGNHDREYVYDYIIKDVVDASKYGHIEAGFTYGWLYGNYSIDIVNKKGVPIHRIIMMDSVDYAFDSVNVARNEFYGWYKGVVKDLPCKSSIIMHIPFFEYFMVYDQYSGALNRKDEALIKPFAPIGLCRKMDSFNTSEIVTGFFPVIKECDNTVNVICGHDHKNDYSLMYDGVRLTYAVKTGPECYFLDSTMCGYTTLKIGSKGETTLNQVYYCPMEY